MFQKKAEIIGIDVGGTKILLETFNKDMQVVEGEMVMTQTEKGKRGFTDQLINLIERHFSKNIKTIGVAAPGIIHRKKGVLVNAPHLPTGRDYPLKKILEDRFKKPVYVDNDINAFLWAEKERPALKRHKNIVAVMIGTGLGGAILNEGQLIYGASGYAGEVGHMVIRQDSPLKTFEQNTSGCHISKIAAKLKLKGKDAHHPTIRKYMAEQLGIGLANLYLIFNPEVIVIGGSIYRNYLANDTKTLERIITSRSLDKKAPKIILASSKTSVALGAAMMASGR
ncbi:ROK family protein [Candidatus Peregrinibacteria bacterium]|nr:ROK family protein [Candidatus Peregrinibacteria bacterium]